MIMNVQNIPTSSNNHTFENNPEDQSNIKKSIRIIFQNKSILMSAPSNTNNIAPERSLKRSLRTFIIEHQQSNAQELSGFNLPGEKLDHTDKKPKENNIDELSTDVVKSQQRLDAAISERKTLAALLQKQIHEGRPLANKLKEKNAYKQLETICTEDLKTTKDRLKSVTKDPLHCDETL
jgi:hypothetical protein